MKKGILILILMVLMLPRMTYANYIQLTNGVYQDGSTLYIGSSVSSLGDLQVNPSEIYCYATIPPACVSNTFTGFDATLHVPAAGMVPYFTALYWYYFNNILSDVIESLTITINTANTELEIGQQLSLSATVVPSDATPKTVCWSSTDPSVATISSGGTVTALASGECDIFATCVDKVAVCHVSVVSPRVTITLDKHEVRLLPNHTMKLLATCSPIDVDLFVTSSNPGVAIPRLVNGSIMVVGVSEGTATITVNTVDGNGNPDSCEVTVYTDLGDVNCDGYVNISDVTKLIDYLLSGNSEDISIDNADTNRDSSINISDVTALIDRLLSGKWPWEHDPNDYVDLGLPSGTLWATCNIGASRPEDRGYYFAWGETSPKDVYNWSTYKWCNGSNMTLTKYCTNGYYGDNGFTDGKTELDPEDDAAYVNWGPSWRMPTREQLDELMMSCSWRWTSNYGVQGYQVEGGNGRKLFLPAGGIRWDGTISDVELKGHYWSCTLNLIYNQPSYLYFYSGNIRWGDSYDRSRGFTVRAVRAAQN